MVSLIVLLLYSVLYIYIFLYLFGNNPDLKNNVGRMFLAEMEECVRHRITKYARNTEGERERQKKEEVLRGFQPYITIVRSGRNSLIHAKVPRYRCPDCGGIHQVDIRWADPNVSYSKTFMEVAIEHLHTCRRRPRTDCCDVRGRCWTI